MLKVTFLLSSEDVPTGEAVAQSPGLRRTRMELARRGTLGRSFDNNSGGGGVLSAVAPGRTRGAGADLALAGTD